jgi:hypothetical protein
VRAPLTVKSAVDPVNYVVPKSRHSDKLLYLEPNGPYQANVGRGPTYTPYVTSMSAGTFASTFAWESWFITHNRRRPRIS